MPAALNLKQLFGDIDVYLFDYLLKGRITPEMRILDAGCGDGRNLVYLLGNGFEVFGVDSSPASIARVRTLAGTLAPSLPDGNFTVESVEKMFFPDDDFDVVISSAVLHFARDEKHWQSMLDEMWRVLKPGGLFFARLASSIGMEDKIENLAGRRYRLPDGTARFLVDEELLARVTESLDGEWVEPLKTVIVQNMRSMSNWCLRKPSPSLRTK